MGIERITIERHVTLDELKAFAGKFGQLENTLSGAALKEAAAPFTDGDGAVAIPARTWTAAATA
jgi:hypothetical protein